MLIPLLLTVLYSFFRWNGVGPATWVGLKNYVTVFQVPDLLGTIINAFLLVIWFSFIPVGLGLVVATVIHRVATGRLGAKGEMTLRRRPRPLRIRRLLRRLRLLRPPRHPIRSPSASTH